MKNPCKRCGFFILGFFIVSANCAELLGRISDETAEVAESEPQAGTQNKQQIIYRVICQAEGEVLPECGQAPVVDALDVTIVPPAVEAEAKPEKVAENSADQLVSSHEDLPKHKSHKSVKIKKTAVDKKHSKKNAAKTSAQSVKRKHR